MSLTIYHRDPAPVATVKPTPQLGAAVDTDHLIGMGIIDERMLILIDIDQLLSGADFGFIEKLAACDGAPCKRKTT